MNEQRERSGKPFLLVDDAFRLTGARNPMTLAARKKFFIQSSLLALGRAPRTEKQYGRVCN
jgi:hypothetical protein